jgi:tryptophan synthase alpha chain
MNRIDKLFKTKKNNILSIYITAGYPKFNDTISIIKNLDAAGVDMIEIGFPFSEQQPNRYRKRNGACKTF